MNGQWRTPTVLRRAAASVAIMALLIGGAKVASIYSAPGTGFSTVQTAAADPTGPTGPGGAGMTGPPGGGSEFVPPSMPSMPDYTGGSQPPLDQNNGVSIYNSGVQSAPSQGNSYPNQAQRGQNPDGTWQTAANGEQNPPNYSTAPAYTGAQSIPNTAPAQPEQGPQQPAQHENQGGHNEQPEQGNQNQQSSQAPTQTQPPDQNDQQILRQCESAAQFQGIPAGEMTRFIIATVAALGGVVSGHGRDVTGSVSCSSCKQQAGPKKLAGPTDEPSDSGSISDRQINCGPPKLESVGDDLDSTIPNTNHNLGGDGKTHYPWYDGKQNPLAPIPKDARPVPTGTALGPNGKEYGFYSIPQYHLPNGEDNLNYVTPNSAIVDLADPTKIVGRSPLAQSSGAYDSASNTMLVAGNSGAEDGDSARELWQSDPLDQLDPTKPYDWIRTLHRIGSILPGDRESQLIALGPGGEGGFMFIGAGPGGVQMVAAPDYRGLLDNFAGKTLVAQDANNVSGVDGVYGPTVTKLLFDTVTKTGSFVLRSSQFWDPAKKFDKKGDLIYDPRTYTSDCTI
ncbi:hypothetical protein [Mycobacteroides salmoniphilum]|nr:hypothetical protein [Mycobacteroides salmoniphilum]